MTDADNANRIQWEKLYEEMKGCRKCGLCDSRRNVVIGRGGKNPQVLFVGEGPGENEDIQGLPFVGQAGKLLDHALNGLMFSEGSYYIANIVKCRPPGNRAPTGEEAEACLPFLRRQLVLLRPKVIVCLGGVAAKYIVDQDAKITRIRGQWIDKKGWLVMPTFHPAALLRDEGKKEFLWRDLKKTKQKLEELEAGGFR